MPPVVGVLRGLALVGEADDAGGEGCVVGLNAGGVDGSVAPAFGEDERVMPRGGERGAGVGGGPVAAAAGSGGGAWAEAEAGEFDHDGDGAGGVCGEGEAWRGCRRR